MPWHSFRWLWTRDLCVTLGSVLCVNLALGGSQWILLVLLPSQGSRTSPVLEKHPGSPCPNPGRSFQHKQSHYTYIILTDLQILCTVSSHSPNTFIYTHWCECVYECLCSRKIFCPSVYISTNALWSCSFHCGTRACVELCVIVYLNEKQVLAIDQDGPWTRDSLLFASKV
jgi:hypothetical protein